MSSNSNLADQFGANPHSMPPPAIQPVWVDVWVVRTARVLASLIPASALAAARIPGSYFIEEGPPLNSAPEKAFRAALKKYEGFSGIPGFGRYEGYTQADLMIKGLEVAGKNPTRQSFITNLRKVKGYTAGGLLPMPIDLSLKDFGKAPSVECSWYAKVSGDTFVTVPSNGKPVCGRTLSVGSS